MLTVDTYEIGADDYQRPRYDKKLRQVDDWVGDVDFAMKHVKNKRVAVQAGGAYGVWPLALARRGFATVYTFEPDAANFTCLARNCGLDPNIVRLQAALGAESGGFVEVVRDDFEADNAGAGYVRRRAGARVPVMALDDFNLTTLDLLCLDVEGYEYAALRGAGDTIDRCRPVIMLEAKQLPQMQAMGVDKDTALRYLEQRHKYRAVEFPHRDVVMVPS